MVGRRHFHVQHIHAQIADDLVRRIASGTYAPGSSLPSETELAGEYGVAPNTVRRALERVAELQLIDRRKGRVATVIDVEKWRTSTKLISTVDRDDNRILGDAVFLNARVDTPSPAVSLALEQKTITPVLRFERRRFHLGRCYMVEDVHLLVRGGDLEGDQSQLMELAETLWWKREVPQAKRERLWIEAVNAQDLALLAIPEGQSVLCIERLLFGTRDRPLEYRVGRCNFGTDLFYLSA